MFKYLELEKKSSRIKSSELCHEDSEWSEQHQEESSGTISKISSSSGPLNSCEKVSLDLLYKIKLWGDLLIRIQHKGSIQTHLICRISLNTSFITEEEYYLPLSELDPTSIQKNSHFSDDFGIKIISEPTWKTWDSKTKSSDLWRPWKLMMQREVKIWDAIKTILEFRNNNISPFT